MVRSAGFRVVFSDILLDWARIARIRGKFKETIVQDIYRPAMIPEKVYLFASYQPFFLNPSHKYGKELLAKLVEAQEGVLIIDFYRPKNVFSRSFQNSLANDFALKKNCTVVVKPIPSSKTPEGGTLCAIVVKKVAGKAPKPKP